MTEKTIVLTIVTPQRRVFQQPVNMVIIRTTEGDIGVLPGHTPLVASLEVGPMTIKVDGGDRRAAVIGGFVEVTPEHVIVLAETAELAEEIDVRRAEAARQRALANLEQKKDQVDFARAQAALQRALVRLQVAGEK